MFNENSIPEITSGHPTFVDLVGQSHLDLNPEPSLSTGMEANYFAQNYLEPTSLDSAELDNNYSDLLTGLESVEPLTVSQSDLTITGMTLSSSIAAGSTLKLSYSIKNIGNAASNAYKTQYYLSSDMTLDSGDIYLGDDSGTYIAVGKTQTRSDSIIMSSSLNPGSYYFLAMADSDNNSLESNESNNLFAQTIQVTKSDLVIDASSITVPSSLIAGQAVTFNYTVKNQGTASTGVSSQTKYYLSTDQTLDGNDAYLGDDAVASLAAGASLTRTDSVMLSGTLNAGNYYFLVQADGNSNVAEADENNNIVAKTVALQGAPDLVVNSLSLPTVIAAGSKAQTSYTIQNVGLSASGASSTRFYLSTNSTFESTDIAIGTDNLAAIAANGSLNRTLTLGVNANTPAGIYYFIGVADGGGTVRESNESNNVLYQLQTVEITQPDLEISQFTVTSANSIAAGSSLNVNYTIANTGNAIAKASVTKYYLSTNETWEASDIYLGDDSLPTLSAGTTLNRTDSFILNTSLESGNYYFLGIADSNKVVAESNENNNLAFHTIEGSSQNQPDLILDPLPGSLVINQGGQIDLSYTIENQGTEVAQNSTTKFYLSTDTSLNNNDIVLGSDGVATLNSGAASTEAVTLSVNNSLNTGTYYVLAQADGENVVTESDENNNIVYQTIQIVETPKPDLLFEQLTLATSITQGSNLALNYRIRNQGLLDAAASTTQFYLSSDAILDSNDLILGSNSVASVASNMATTQNITLAIGNNINPGTYYLFGQVDSGNVLIESDENNNLIWRTLQVTEPPKPDLLINSLVTPSQVNKGSNLVVAYNVQNQGNAGAAASTTKFYLSTNTTLDNNDLYLGSDSVAAIASGGESSEDTLLAISSSINAGTYYLIAQTDAESGVSESNENNNFNSWMVQITESGVSDLTINPLTVTVNGLRLTVSYTIKNQGTLSTAASNTKFYLSANNTLEATDTLLGNDAVAALGANASSVESVSLTLANNLTAGTYYLLAQADGEGAITESDESNNVTSSTLSLKPDLTLTGLSLSNGTNRVTQAVAFNPAYTLQNTGNAIAPSQSIKYTLSRDGVLGNADDVLFKYLSNAGADKELAAGVSRLEKDDALVINEALTPGMYTCFMQIDSTNIVGESNENNNTAAVQFEFVIPPKPDLIIEKLNSPNTANLGGFLNLSYRLRNIDQGYAGYTQLGFYLSKDGVVDASDINLGYHLATGDTPTGASIDRNWSLLLNSSTVTAGNYNLIAVIDPLYATKESNETNNTLMRSITINSLLLPDISMTNISFATSASDGTPLLETGKLLAIPYTVKNSGSAIKSSTTEFYISTDAVYDSFDLRLGSHQIDAMGAGETRSTTASIYFNPSFVDIGTKTYYLITKVDGGGGSFVSAESNETNNVAIRPVTVANSGTAKFTSGRGYGLVNAAAAVAAATGSNPYPDVSNVDKNWGVDRLSAPEVWAQGYTGQGITVAVIDTGVDYTHPDLVNNIWSNSGEIAGNGIDDDGNGYIDDVRGWDFVDKDNTPLDGQSHGTHVAGIIAASRNSIGYTGVAPGAKIMPLRVIGGGDEWGSINNAIRYAVDNGARVINISLGGGTVDQDGRLKEFLRYASERGVTVVMAAGNYGDASPIQPGSFADRWGLVVGAVDQTGNRTNYSNQAGTRGEMGYVLAPGSSTATVPGNKYAGKSGTSMASPHVAGVVALMLSANPNLTDAQVREIITRTADSALNPTDTIPDTTSPSEDITLSTLEDMIIPTASELPNLNS